MFCIYRFLRLDMPDIPEGIEPISLLSSLRLSRLLAEVRLEGNEVRLQDSSTRFLRLGAEEMPESTVVSGLKLRLIYSRLGTAHS